MRFSSATDDTLCGILPILAYLCYLCKSLQITCSLSVIICMTRVRKANIYREALSIKSICCSCCVCTCMCTVASHVVCICVVFKRKRERRCVCVSSIDFLPLSFSSAILFLLCLTFIHCAVCS